MINYVKLDQVICTGCGACIDSCPTDVIRQDAQSQKAYLAYPEDCQVCFLCEFDCPVDAVLVSPRGWGESIGFKEHKGGSRK